ncbi:MAG: HEAT repeat domain-containing protein [bacterium]|nr:HEAT repeat domain-containing protein [bacterium]
MDLPDEQALINLAKQFKIAQDFPAQDKIKLLKRLERIDGEKLCIIFNYFLTLENDKEVLTYLVKILAKCQNELTLKILADILISSLNDTSDTCLKLKCEIANTMGRSQNSECVMPLLYVMNNKNENYKLRLACADALGRIGSSYAVTPLIDLVRDDEEKSMYLRESAARALGMLGDMRAIEPLANILESKNGLFDRFTFLKERIVETLGRLGQYGDEKSIHALKHALEDEAACVRLGAIDALSEIDDDRVIPLIEKMLEDKDEEVARAAVCALYEILGKGYICSLYNSESLQACCKDEIRELLEEQEEIEVEADRNDE